ncbi:MAG TPA: hypothetical protein PLZ93_20155 [Nocardioides sp.]|uniref:hypothetical protein n=1 Tax=uncultured Nocardioides sp. TaxID=198441 RepID=UPI00262D4C3B|nr:hypothetical protein [uncultured Nocardioides sp.]HRD63059.1 hypothetical protein [Nocardioides sp.]HRI97946.1 hypothetical protein [Nocardioides sp.]HRK46446.1 hypothetical protein [Nocardioides sp.]
MNTVHLTDEQLTVARNGMEAFLQGFSHDEADVVRAIRSVIAALAAAESEPAAS